MVVKEATTQTVLEGGAVFRAIFAFLVAGFYT
jgi:hypothetical protein